MRWTLRSSFCVYIVVCMCVFSFTNKWGKTDGKKMVEETPSQAPKPTHSSGHAKDFVVKNDWNAFHSWPASDWLRLSPGRWDCLYSGEAGPFAHTHTYSQIHTLTHWGIHKDNVFSTQMHNGRVGCLTNPRIRETNVWQSVVPDKVVSAVRHMLYCAHALLFHLRPLSSGLGGKSLGFRCGLGYFWKKKNVNSVYIHQKI